MRILLIGYGKMGKAIEEIAKGRRHEIVACINIENRHQLESITSAEVDVAIEFTEPDSAYQNIRSCLEKNIPVVSGTTGWLERKPEIEQFCQEQQGAFLYASNFSIGVNLFFKLNQYLAQLMNRHPQYDVKLEEIHHLQKKDSPSGTAISLANDIIERLARKRQWKVLEMDKQPRIYQMFENTDLQINALRQPNVPGTHTVSYVFSDDTINIQHIAHSRHGFALGAVLAAEWLHSRKGVFSMNDVLEL